MDYAIIEHCPILYFHREEKYFPSSVDYYLKNSDVKLDDETVLSSPTQKELYLFSKTNPKASKATMHPKKNIKEGEDYYAVPCYAFFHELDSRFVYITYVYFYPYNGAYKFLCGKEIGGHHADIKHITIELTPNLIPIRYYFSAHGFNGGEWKFADEIDKENERAIVYVSKHKHRYYSKPKNVFRKGGFANDKVERGLKWDPVPIIIRPDDELFIENKSWIYYPGKWAPDDILGVVSQKWWKEIPEGTRHIFVHNIKAGICLFSTFSLVGAFIALVL